MPTYIGRHQLRSDQPRVQCIAERAHGQGPETLIAHQGWQDPFAREIAHFLDVVIGGAPLRATPQDARANVQVVLAAYESAQTGREVQIVPRI